MLVINKQILQANFLKLQQSLMSKQTQFKKIINWEFVTSLSSIYLLIAALFFCFLKIKEFMFQLIQSKYSMEYKSACSYICLFLRDMFLEQSDWPNLCNILIN